MGMMSVEQYGQMGMNSAIRNQGNAPATKSRAMSVMQQAQGLREDLLQTRSVMVDRRTELYGPPPAQCTGGAKLGAEPIQGPRVNDGMYGVIEDTLAACMEISGELRQFIEMV